MEIIKLEIKEDEFINISNPFGEKSHDYLCKNTFCFERGKRYGLICEHGGGGETISLLLSNELSLKKGKILVDNVEVNESEFDELGWYVGKTLYSKSIWKKEITIKNALELAVKKSERYETIDEVIDEFHLSRGKLGYSLSRNCEWEKWRASLAIGYASGKKIFCFPWMNTLQFYDCMYNSAVFLFFKKILGEGGIVILPTSRKENVSGLVDEIIEIDSPRFKHIISDSSYFKENY